MSCPVLPLIIADGLDIGIYDSTGAAQRALEAEDVASDSYVCFDAEGRRFDIGLDVEGAVIRDFPGSQSGPAALERLLRDYLAYLKDPAALEPGESLGRLIAAARRYARR
ncbi:MAG: hypothetical protein U0529_02140 [Thermoanaerobaculia bacterium]